MSQHNNRSIRLVQISDTHCYADNDAQLEWCQLPVYPNRALQRLLEHLGKRAQDYEAIILTGDLAQEETAATYQQMKEILENFPRPAFVLPGNHDIPALMQNHLRPSANIRFIPQTRFGDWHCLFLDTSRAGSGLGYLEEAQLAELKQQLDEVAEHEHTLIFMHHHPLPINSQWMDAMGLQAADTFWNLLEAYRNVRAVCFGHIHHAFTGEHVSASGQRIAVFGTPSTCLQLKHDTTRLEYDHTDPAWRELILHPGGKIDTQVNYLPAYL